MIADLKGYRILVLGGAGFIGQHLCRALLLSGADVRCFDLNLPKKNSIVYELEKRAEWLRGDFSDADQLKAAVDGMDYVFHLVSSTIPDTSNSDLQYDISSNVLSTLMLLEVVKYSSVKKLIFISSGGTVYGIPKTIPISELHETNPICGYGIHKLAIEKYLYLYHYNHGLDYCILRLSNPYGEAQISDRSQGVIGKFVYKVIMREKLEIWGDGNVVRDYIYIDDVIDALLLTIRYEGKEKVLNVSSGKGHSLRDIVTLMENEAETPLEVTFTSSRHVDVPLNVLDNSLIKSELKWKPSVDMKSGIRKLFEYGNLMKSRL